SPNASPGPCGSPARAEQSPTSHRRACPRRWTSPRGRSPSLPRPAPPMCRTTTSPMRPPRRTRSRELSEPLRDVPEYTNAPEYDEERAAAAVREFLIAVGEDPNRPGLQETPVRV